MRHHPLGIFASGFVVYAIVAATVGAGERRASIVDPVPAAKADSGSRLKGKYLAGSDGSRDYLSMNEGWFNANGTSSNHSFGIYYDSQRMEDCAFQTAADSQLRCLPIDLTPNPSTNFFTDAACTQPVASVTTPQPGCTVATPKYTFTNDTTTVCPLTSGFFPTHIYTLGALVGSGSYCGYAMNNGVCAQQCSNSAQTAYYGTTGEVDPTSFVAATPMIDP